MGGDRRGAEADYEIPVSSPSHAVTYVTVQETNNDAVVFATAAAFTGAMIAFGCVVWAAATTTRHTTGLAAVTPTITHTIRPTDTAPPTIRWTGAYTRGVSAYGPYGGAGAAQRYNPRTGTYSRGAVAYGPYGARGAAQAYNPRTGTSAGTRQGSNIYGSWGATGVQRGDQWATTARTTNNATGVTRRTTQTSGGGEAVRRTGPGGTTSVGRTGSGDVYASRNGEVYRKQGESYQRYDGGGGWSNAQQPSEVTRDSAARAEGATRTADQSSVRSGTSTRTGSYRASGSAGGGSRTRSGGGGGGRRR